MIIPLVPRFDAHAFDDLASLFDSPGYAGYKPAVREAPNGGTKACEACVLLPAATHNCPFCHGTGRVPNVDTGKRYLHVARKYDPPAWAEAYLALAHWEACKIAERIGVPDAFMPRTEDSTLRVLEYPSAACESAGRQACKHCGGNILARGQVCPALAAGAGTAEHTDPNLFTVNLWRSTPEDHEQYDVDAMYEERGGRAEWVSGAPEYHLGEIGELVGLGRAVLHRVPARPYTQRALVYFAIPSHAARLPQPCGWRGVHGNRHGHGCGCQVTVGEWLAERMKRSRVYT